MPAPKYLLLDQCPVPYDLAPYFYLVLRRAGVNAVSIYRGDDPAAKPLLHRFGKHTQRELANATPAQRAAWQISGTPNRPGQSMHELRSDGKAKRGPVGRVLADWEVGCDAGPNTDSNRRSLIAAAHHYGLTIYFPYDSQVEYHHFGFKYRPKADGTHLFKPQVIAVRAKLRLETARAMKGHW